MAGDELAILFFAEGKCSERMAVENLTIYMRRADRARVEGEGPRPGGGRGRKRR